MIRNYFITALRIIKRNKLFSAINILGLAIGICSSLVIFLIIFFEFSFDRFQEDRDRIFRVVIDAKFGDSEGHSAGVPSPLSKAVAKEITGIDQVIPVFQLPGDAMADVIIAGDGRKENIVFKNQKEIILAGREYMQLQGYRWLAGNAATSLEKPFTVVLTESRARNYFPGVSVSGIIGRKITYNEITATVSGVVQDLDQLTDLKGKEFISLPTIEATSLKDHFMMDVWSDWMANTHLYLKLSKGNTAEKAAVQINKLFARHYNAVKRLGDKITFVLQPLADIHFNDQYQSFDSRIASKPTLYSLLAVAAFLLALGCINFINLSTAQASQRAKEIGIRKTMGSSQKLLVAQLLGETFLITLAATLLSVIFAPWILQLFAEYIPEGLTRAWLLKPIVPGFLLLLTIFVSVAAGIYPALVLCGYKPVKVLKGVVLLPGQLRHTWIRKTLTVFQFVIAQFLLIGTIMVSKQIRFLIQADMGFNKEAVLRFNIPRDSVSTNGNVLLNKINAIAGVHTVSSGFFSPADEGVAFANISYYNGKEEIRPEAQIRWRDSNYLKVYDLKLVAGRMVVGRDSVKEFLINESFARAMGFRHPQEAVGAYLKWNDNMVPIVGVMKDFHDMSMKSTISPLVFWKESGATFHVRLMPRHSGSSWAASIADIEKIFNEMYPEATFSYSFVDEMIERFYKSEQATAGLLTWATGLAIFISCLGLLGLVIYTTNSRAKEIGMRKVLGAPVTSIVSLLSREFVLLVMLAFIIAAPLAWWAGYTWLQQFAYQRSLSWWVFLLSGLLMLLIAIITLSVRTLRTAMANPVDALRSE